MKIIGWIRVGDKAACGGTVLEGHPNVTAHGRLVAYRGARMACRKNCVIIEGHPHVTLPNGREVPHHGHLTSGGCPLISTLNDIYGWENESGEEILPAFVPDGEGNWRGIYPPEQEHDETHDEYFIALDEKDGSPRASVFTASCSTREKR
jgi:uncharacterized Zn-binding protein involved in type VI secretion